MKIKQANAGPLTNFEVLDFLRLRGASKDSTKRVMAEIKPSEYKVFDYLVESAACNQTRECINKFLEECQKEYDLAQAELFNIINIRPSSPAQVSPLLEDIPLPSQEGGSKPRFGEGFETKLMELIEEILPPDPNLPVQDDDIEMENPTEEVQTLHTDQPVQENLTKE